MNMKKVIIADSVRTAWGKPGAGLAPFISSDFSAKVLTELLARTGVDANAVDQVVFGQAHPSTMPNNIGHYAWLKAELPVTQNSIQDLMVQNTCPITQRSEDMIKTLDFGQ